MKLGRRGEPVHVHLTDEQRAEANRRSNRWLLAILGGAVLCGLVGGLLGALLPHHHRQTRHHHASTAGAVIEIVVGVAVIAIAITFIIWMYRRQTIQQVFQFSYPRRRRVLKALRKGRPVSDEDLPVAAASVSMMQRQWRQIYVFPLLALVFLLQVFEHHGVIRWLYVAIIVAYLALWPYAVWQRRQIFRNWDRIAPRYREIMPSPTGQT